MDYSAYSELVRQYKLEASLAKLPVGDNFEARTPEQWRVTSASMQATLLDYMRQEIKRMRDIRHALQPDVPTSEIVPW